MTYGLVMSLALLLGPILGAAWTAYDAFQRRMVAPVWAIAVLVVLPLALPVYFAVRTLKPGETREGGRGWNILRNLALAWTLGVLLFMWAVAAPVLQMPLAPAAWWKQIGLHALFGVSIWVGPMLVALLVGAFLRQAGVIERGPPPH